jgi:predicted nucleic acid-binding protein
MATAVVYFDTSIFLAIFNGEPEAKRIRDLLTELRRDKVRIYTSIITVEEVSVLSFRRGHAVHDNHRKVNLMARIETITREIALTASKLEAGIVDAGATADNKRRKWDCFHLATAMMVGARTFYALDDHFQTRKQQLGLTIPVERPMPSRPGLPFPIPLAPFTPSQP